MGDPPPSLAYRSPAEDRYAGRLVPPMRPYRVDLTALSIGLYQTVHVVLLVTIWFETVTEGPWFAWAMWPIGLTVPSLCNFAGASCVLLGAIDKPVRRRRWYRAFVILTVATLLLSAIGLAIASRWPIYVSDQPDAPAVNDSLLYVTTETVRSVYRSLLLGWPMLIVLLNRHSCRRLRRNYVRFERVRRNALRLRDD